ncbi:VTC domain-containing protein [Agathobacter sp.]
MSEQMIFKRCEIKYMIDEKTFDKLMQVMSEHMIADVHGRSTVCSLYFDTPDYLLIRRSMDHPIYKEKLRLRSYGVADEDTQVFVELKKKFNSVVYKRRISMTEKQSQEYLSEHKKIMDTQISREIDYCMRMYKGLAPAVLLSYEREAFYAKDDHEFRVTFDRNILWRDYDLSLCKGIYGAPILEQGQVLMEVKTAGAIPRWMVDFLTENHIYKTSFSKYGTAYRTICEHGRLSNTQEDFDCENVAAAIGLMNA